MIFHDISALGKSKDRRLELPQPRHTGRAEVMPTLSPAGVWLQRELRRIQNTGNFSIPAEKEWDIKVPIYRACCFPVHLHFKRVLSHSNEHGPFRNARSLLNFDGFRTPTSAERVIVWCLCLLQVVPSSCRRITWMKRIFWEIVSPSSHTAVSAAAAPRSSSRRCTVEVITWRSHGPIRIESWHNEPHWLKR